LPKFKYHKVIYLLINNSMPQISSFNHWLAESSAPDPARLLELGLWDGPGLQWRLVDWINPAWASLSNPEIGHLQIIYDFEQIDRDGIPETWTLYPSSFGPASELVLAAWARWQQSQEYANFQHVELAGVVRDHLHLAVRKYAHFKLTGLVPARHWRTRTLLPPGEAPGWSEWYPFNTFTTPADLRPSEVQASRRSGTYDEVIRLKPRR